MPPHSAQYYAPPPSPVGASPHPLRPLTQRVAAPVSPNSTTAMPRDLPQALSSMNRMLCTAPNSAHRVSNSTSVVHHCRLPTNTAASVPSPPPLRGPSSALVGVVALTLGPAGCQQGRAAALFAALSQQSARLAQLARGQWRRTWAVHGVVSPPTGAAYTASERWLAGGAGQKVHVTAQPACTAAPSLRGAKPFGTAAPPPSGSGLASTPFW